jgi:hypothetical protein
MIKIKHLYTALLFMLFYNAKLLAQTPSDALMMEAKQACILLDYNFGSFNQYWEGSLLRENQTIATVKRSTVMPMVAVGIGDNLNLYIGAPHIKTESTEPNGGKFAGASGFQDLTIALKYRVLNKQTDKGTLSVLATGGFSTPISNYLSDYMPYSLGLGAPELSYRGIAQYRWKSGLYLRGSAAYLWRGYTEAEREYYYNNGSYYTPFMDVPNAVSYEGIVGYWLLNNSVQLELNYMGLKSTSGDDIRAYNAAQPTNKVELSRVGFFAHFYFSKMPGLGIVAYRHGVITGRNTAKITTTGIGATYFFNYLKK